LFFWEEYFHKIQHRETLSGSRNELNTTDTNKGLTGSFSSSAESVMHTEEFKIFHFEISSGLFVLIFIMLGEN
jgi:hypothetical protein